MCCFLLSRGEVGSDFVDAGSYQSQSCILFTRYTVFLPVKCYVSSAGDRSVLNGSCWHLVGDSVSNADRTCLASAYSIGVLAECSYFFRGSDIDNLYVMKSNQGPACP